MTRRRPSALSGDALYRVLLGGVVLTVTGCAEVPEEAAEVHQPAVVEHQPGDRGAVVRFDAVAAEQVDLRTAGVQAAHRGTTVPYAALIYDPDGTVWVYAAEDPLTYRREEVVVARIHGRTAWLREGPAPGTRVVTRGATEVYGAQLGIAGGH